MRIEAFLKCLNGAYTLQVFARRLRKDAEEPWETLVDTMATSQEAGEEFDGWFPVTHSNAETGETQIYEKPFDLWSDFEHFDSRDELKPHESFSDRFGRLIDFKTTAHGFIEFIRCA